MFGHPSFVGIKKVRVVASDTSVAAGGSTVVEVSVPAGGIIVGLPVLVSKGSYTGIVRVLYASSDGFAVELTNSDDTNPQDVSAVFDVYVIPDIL